MSTGTGRKKRDYSNRNYLNRTRQRQLEDWFAKNIGQLKERGANTEDAATAASASLSFAVTKGNAITALRTIGHGKTLRQARNVREWSRPGANVLAVAKFVVLIAEKIGEPVPDEVRNIIARSRTAGQEQ